MIPTIEGVNTSELIKSFREDLRGKQTRELYAEAFLSAYIATQIKVLREEAGWTQSVLAEKAGMKQERISVLEDIDYSSWTANVLKRLAKAFDLHLSIKFESFGSLVEDFRTFGRDALLRLPFSEDPAFHETTWNPQGTATATYVGQLGLDLVPVETEVIDAKTLRITYEKRPTQLEQDTIAA